MGGFWVFVKQKTDIPLYTLIFQTLVNIGNVADRCLAKSSLKLPEVPTKMRMGDAFAVAVQNTNMTVC
jgi:hypothetical protein